MVQKVNQQETKELLSKIAALYTIFHENEDFATAKKAKELAVKLKEREFAVAFCGHFSAGKSSMINRLVGENLLPSSPIPTSANLVKVKSGDEYAKVFFKEGNPRLYPAPYDYETVKTLCKDGDQIESIEISHRMGKLPENSCIMDTPGIDSTDEAHRIATESALHLADLVFYVMDYNHVQSELNFLFTKELTDRGKKVYLVINQIDKHREEELEFEHFKETVRQSFASWGVYPAGLFYTSLKEEAHPKNEFTRLQAFIYDHLAEREHLLFESVYHSVKTLIDEHQVFLKQRDQIRLKKVEEELSSLTEEEQVQLGDRLLNMERDLIKMESFLREKDEDLANRVEDILKNAYLMPFETRECAKKYLESRQPEFKVGFFSAKKKTEEERKKRLDHFYENFKEKVKSQLEWHLKELFNKTLRSDDVHESELLLQIQNFQIPIKRKVLESAVKSGALLSGEYVLNYTTDVANEAKQLAKAEANKVINIYLGLLQKRIEHRKKQLANEIDQLRRLTEAFKNKQNILEKHAAVKIKMEQYINGYFDHDEFEPLTEQLIKNSTEPEIVMSSMEKVEGKEAVNEAVKEREVLFKKEKGLRKNNDVRVKNTVRKLRYSQELLKEIPGFKKVADVLRNKGERLENRGFTVALFGAFSAGKSSFANALIGEKLLPVSPNPTTAAINKIMPVNEENEHGTVKVKLKESTSLLEDVKRSLSVFDLRADTLDGALEQIGKVMESRGVLDSHEKTHFAFLQAFAGGFGTFRDKLGECIDTDIGQFAQFVAQEEKSCFVETIEVYFDCELTRKGITLVDTPGADSINARHTGVAFDYIKNSDAILFVTYYNHAFSKADREFLIQLGRVKDTFELDKMFFIVNAVDLANSNEEKHAVLKYVEDQLVKYGIRHPYLFPVSSLTALEEKLGKVFENKSGMATFEECFYSFITHDLMNIAITSAEGEWKRAVTLLGSYIKSAQEDNNLKQKKILALKDEQKQVKELIEGIHSDFLLNNLNQEVDELIYYLKQRVFYRFYDFFKESFNPSIIKDDGRDLRKVLHHSLEDFLSNFGFDFSQELRATTLRIEAFMGKSIQQVRETVIENIKEINGELTFSQFQIGRIEGIEFQSAFADLDRGLFKKALSYFKNPKSFFEQNDKRFMEEELNRVLQDAATEYLSKESQRLKEYYGDEFQNKIESMKIHAFEDIDEYYDGMFAALKNEIPVEQLMELEKKIVNYS